MAQNRKQRRISGRDVHVTRGHFPLSGGRFVRVEFPAKLTTQGKYDVATALAKAAAKLVAEADAANAELHAAQDEMDRLRVRLSDGDVAVAVPSPRGGGPVPDAGPGPGEAGTLRGEAATRVPYDPAARHARAVQTEVELGLRPAEAACKHDDPLVIDGQTAWCPPCGALYGMKAWRLPEGRSRPEVRPGCITCATEPALPGKLHCAGHEAGRLSPGEATPPSREWLEGENEQLRRDLSAALLVTEAAWRYVTALDAHEARDWDTFTNENLASVSVEFARFRERVLSWQRRRDTGDVVRCICERCGSTFVTGASYDLHYDSCVKRRRERATKDASVSNASHIAGGTAAGEAIPLEPSRLDDLRGGGVDGEHVPELQVSGVTPREEAPPVSRDEQARSLGEHG